MLRASFPVAAAAAALTLSPAASAEVISPFFGYDQSQNAQAGTNPVDAFQTGASGNNNISTAGADNEFTLTFITGTATGTASFAVTDSNIGNADLRQFANALGGPGATDQTLTVTLTGTDNLDSLTLDGVSITSDQLNNFTATLPDGTTTTDNEVAVSAWAVGQTLELGYLGNGANSYNVRGFTVDGVAVVPEPASLALLGLGGLAILGRRRG